MTLEDLTQVVGTLQTEVARLNRRAKALEPKQSSIATDRTWSFEPFPIKLRFNTKTQQQQHHPKQP